MATMVDCTKCDGGGELCGLCDAPIAVCMCDADSDDAISCPDCNGEGELEEEV